MSRVFEIYQEQCGSVLDDAPDDELTPSDFVELLMRIAAEKYFRQERWRQSHREAALKLAAEEREREAKEGISIEDEEDDDKHEKHVPNALLDSFKHLLMHDIFPFAGQWRVHRGPRTGQRTTVRRGSALLACLTRDTRRATGRSSAQEFRTAVFHEPMKALFWRHRDQLQRIFQ